MVIPYFYAGQIRKYLFAFADVFNGIQIARYNPDETVNHYDTIPIIFPNQDKYFTYYNQQISGGVAVNPNVKIELGKTLPSFSINDLSFTFDSERSRNKYDMICEATKHSFVPTPYRIGLSLKFNFEKLDECFQVIEQILPLLNTVLSINVNPIDTNFANNLSIPIFLESSSNLFPSDIAEGEERIQQFVFNVRMDVWLFGRVIDNSSITSNIDFNKKAQV